MLDEPFENLDPSTQIRLKKLVDREKEEKNTTFVISSHDITGTRQERVDALRAYFEGGN